MNISSASLFSLRSLLPLKRRLQSIGLSKRDAARFGHYIRIQVRNQQSGAIEFLKRLSRALLNALTGETVPTPWIKTRNGFPASMLFLKKYSRKILFRLTKLHSFITLNSVTKKQAAKFMDAVRTPRPSEESLTNARDFISRGSFVLPSQLKDRRLVSFPLALMPLQQQAKASSLSKLSPKRRRAATIEKSADLVNRSLDYLNSPIWRDLLVTPPVYEAFYPLDKGYFAGLTDLYSNKLHSAPVTATKHVAHGNYRIEPAYVGTLGYSQESGGKLRVFASPHLVWQAIFEPLKLLLMDALRCVPQDCTHNQQKGADWAQEQLQKGVKLHSLDLSNATDLFPLSLQLGTLTELGVSATLSRIFERVATGSWKVPKAIREHGYPVEVKWERGQPLGLAPSFPLFALTHHMLVYGICVTFGVDPDCYRILGDDIIIGNDEVARQYVAVMEEMGCKIAHEKSISSTNSAEFAGFHITKDEMVRPGKFRKLTTQNILEVAKSLESDLAHEVHPELSAALRKYLSLPKEFGGIGAEMADPEETAALIAQMEEKRLNILRSSSGDILERRCAQVVLAAGLVTRLPMHSLSNSRFTQYHEILDYGVTKGFVTPSLIKAHGVTWAIMTIESCVKAQLCDPARDVMIDAEMRRKFSVPLSAELPVARKRVNQYFQRYYASVGNVCNHNILLRWLEDGILKKGETKLRSLLP